MPSLLLHPLLLHPLLLLPLLLLPLLHPLLVGIGRYKISEGTSVEGIPNTSFSKQGHRYGAVYQLSHV